MFLVRPALLLVLDIGWSWLCFLSILGRALSRLSLTLGCVDR
jgi:hypothetical protein